MSSDTSDSDHRAYTGVVPFPEEMTLRPLARVVSPYLQRHGTPRQPGFAGAKEHLEGLGEIHLLDGFDPLLFQDLDGFERIWLVSFMHLNRAFGRPTVRPPRGGSKRGLLATRAPHRPNPIALSCVELLAVKGPVLQVRGLDLLNDTPVLDIKPYIGAFDAFPESKIGWLEGLL
jgi:tRNA-Thr(GGU) m(6)t(6)A37 methyltransferase TsaA